MKFMQWAKDGGQESTVSGLFFVEIKGLFSVALLRFGDGSRDAYHSHAFNCFSWLLKGGLTEYHKDGGHNPIFPSLVPFGTYRDTFHKVVSHGVSWVFTVRGPWAKTWNEYVPDTEKELILADGRVDVTLGMCMTTCIMHSVLMPEGGGYRKPPSVKHAPNCPNVV